jgi:hypothetical protein
MELAYRVLEISEKELTDSDVWRTKKSWMIESDGIAKIALSPIRFWDRMGRLSLCYLVARIFDDAPLANKISTFIAESIRNNDAIHRVVWTGQYPDITAALGCAASVSTDVVRDTADRILKRLLEDADNGCSPVSVADTERETGTMLAKFFCNEPIESFREADEGIAILVMILTLLGESEIRNNALIAHLQTMKKSGNYILYRPQNVVEQYQENMVDCDVMTWARNSLESSAEFVKEAGKICTAPYIPTSPTIYQELLSGLAAARFYRNRANFGVAGVLISEAIAK